MRITNVDYVSDYKLQVTFYTGESVVFDFETFISTSKHESIHKYIDKSRFKKVKLVTGFLSWNRGEMEISGEWIYTETHKKQVQA